MIDIHLVLTPTAFVTILPAILVLVFVFVFLHVLRRTPAGRYLLILALFVVCWSIGYTFNVQAATQRDALFWARFSTTFLLFIPSFFYLFTVSLLRHERLFAGVQVLVISCSLVFAVIHLLTGCFFSDNYLRSWGYFPRYHRSFLLFLLFFAVIGALVVRELVAHRRSTHSSAMKLRDRLLLAAWAIAALGSLDFLIGFGVSLRPVSPLVISTFVLLAMVILFRQGMPDFFQYMDLPLILRFTQDPILVINTEGLLRSMDQATLKKIGITDLRYIQGQAVNSLFSTDTPLFTDESIQTVKEKDFVPTRVLDLLTTSGETIPIRVGLSGIFSKRRELIGLIAIGRDIRDEIRRSEELVSVNRSLREKILEVEESREGLARANEALEQSGAEIQNMLADTEVSHRRLEEAYQRLAEIDRTKDSVLSSVSHELRTPLTSIRSFSEILIQYPDESEETRMEFMRIIFNESERLTRLVNGLLDLARIESGNMEWRREEVDLVELVEGVAQSFSVQVVEKGLTLSCVPQKDLPALLLDKDRIVQVITNLLSNAVKFTPAGGSITISADRVQEDPGDESRKPAIRIQVTDTGRGIPERDLHRIFDKFFQVSNDSDGKPTGTGLGLAISREIVQRFNGHIFVESKEGQGSTFSIFLPIPGLP